MPRQSSSGSAATHPAIRPEFLRRFSGGGDGTPPAAAWLRQTAPALSALSLRVDGTVARSGVHLDGDLPHLVADAIAPAPASPRAPPEQLRLGRHPPDHPTGAPPSAQRCSDGTPPPQLGSSSQGSLRSPSSHRTGLVGPHPALRDTDVQDRSCSSVPVLPPAAIPDPGSTGSGRGRTGRAAVANAPSRKTSGVCGSMRLTRPC